jgi:diacylglycerol kinase (ATP)
MPMIAVVAHTAKSFGGGLRELREVLAREGFADPLWYEVTKSRKAPKYARRALARGAEVIFVWGGDGTVQRCIDAVAGTEAGRVGPNAGPGRARQGREVAVHRGHAG